jgi:DNA polymerase-3 subunit delta
LLLIHGEEQFLARQLIRALRSVLAGRLPDGEAPGAPARLAGADDAVDYLEWDEEAGVAELQSALTTPPLGASWRLVVARDPRPELCLPYLKPADPALVLVLLYTSRLRAGERVLKEAAARGWVVECTPLKGKELVAWAQSEARLRGRQLPTPAAEYLHFLCGDSPGLISQELDKAIMFSGETSPAITVAVLKEIGSHTAGRSIFELVDAVAARRRDVALEILDGLLSQGQAPVYLAAMLSRHFLQLLEASLLVAEGTALQALSSLMGVHPYAARKLYQQAAAFPRPEIEAILSMLLSLDHDLKRGRGEPGLLLEASVGEICSKKPPALQAGRSCS